MRELDDETGIGLIEKRRQGFGKVNVIYVKTFMPEKTDEKKFGEELEKFKKQTSVENEETAEVYNLNFMKSQNQTSRSPENKLQEVYISNPNNTNLSDTEMNDNKSNHIIQMITENGTMKYSHMKNKVFSGNLMLIDTYMEEIIAHLLLLYYQNQATDSDKLIRIIEEQNPLGYPRKGIYAYKFKKFLCSIALGMMPSKEWDGHDEANGGYVIVKDNGEVLAYHIYNRDAFEKYLLNNTKFERG